MELNDKVTQLEDEIKILKNEVQAVLLDLRESYLNNENPFNANAGNNQGGQPIIINQPAPTPPPEAPPMPDPSCEAEPEPEENVSELPEKKEDTPVVPKPEVKIQDITPMAEPDFPESQHAEIREAGIQRPSFSTFDETSIQDVVKGWRPNTNGETSVFPGKSGKSPVSKIDLENISKLAEWVETSVSQIGHSRTQTALELSEMLGILTLELKNVLLKFINPASEGNEEKITTRDYLAPLIELSGLLGRDNRSEVALLYILCQENEK